MLEITCAVRAELFNSVAVSRQAWGKKDFPQKTQGEGSVEKSKNNAERTTKDLQSFESVSYE